MTRNLLSMIFVTTTTLVLLSCNKDDVIQPDKPESGVIERPITPLSSEKSVTVFEWTPAPGQFINEATMVNDIAGDITGESVARWAQSRLDKQLYVSLGGFGGYIVVGFDHSIKASESEYDFAIVGNAFYLSGTTSGGSSEPGIVYVMQDTNGNGLPDDTWYELEGSDTFTDETMRDYAVTYYRPSAPESDVEWTDNRGNSGKIPYLKTWHKQAYYYPEWVTADTYTLTGTCMAHRTTLDANGIWSNNPFGWGYADNMGVDNTQSLPYGAQCNRFRISDAIDKDGKSVVLNHIDFIKVQTGVCSSSSLLGEVSTEVCGFIDLSMLR